jgi:type I restriction enzyme M protein
MTQARACFPRKIRILSRGAQMTDEQKKKLEQKLWDIANTLRGKMGADEFRDYILGFIFYKYLSERMNLYADRILGEDGVAYTDIPEGKPQGEAVLEAVRDASLEALGYFLRPSELFTAVARRGAEGQFILGELQTILNNIERSTMGTESEEDFDHLFEDLDLSSTKLGRSEEAKNDLISKVLTHLDAIDFALDDADSDILGDAYEYLIGQFASGAGKKAGEFYTPQEVSTILARIVTTGKSRLRSVYDPTCGSGSLLLRVAREVGQVDDFFGQEMNRTTYNLARMNMILHGVSYRNFNLRQEDTLEHPQHEGMLFEAIVANPPFSAKWAARPVMLSDDRFAQYGRLAPASKADFAFVQHMLAHLDDNGTMAVVLPHGALFRGGAEGAIREFIIREKNWLDAVIGLPANIFYGTSIPTCLMVFKKCRETEDVLFVDASGCFEKAKNQNYLREGDIDQIVTAYRTRAVVARFSHRASRAEIAGNDYNLNIPRYVETFEAAAAMDLAAVTAELRAVEADMAGIDAQLRAFCAELGLESPV